MDGTHRRTLSHYQSKVSENIQLPLIPYSLLTVTRQSTTLSSATHHVMSEEFGGIIWKPKYHAFSKFTFVTGTGAQGRNCNAIVVGSASTRGNEL